MRAEQLVSGSAKAGRAMTAAQAGDSGAYERLLLSLVPELRAFVEARLPDSPRADDVVHNLLLSIHRVRHTYRPERSFSPWLWAIAERAVSAQHLSARK